MDQEQEDQETDKLLQGELDLVQANFQMGVTSIVR